MSTDRDPPPGDATADPDAAADRPPESRGEALTAPRSLDSVIAELQRVGAARIRLVSEDETGYRYDENGEVLLEVKAIYDHDGMEERLRRRLAAVGDTVRWQAGEVSFDFRVGAESIAEEGATVYDGVR